MPEKNNVQVGDDVKKSPPSDELRDSSHAFGMTGIGDAKEIRVCHSRT
jgi:hypothetical protein